MSKAAREAHRKAAVAAAALRRQQQQRQRVGWAIGSVAVVVVVVAALVIARLAGAGPATKGQQAEDANSAQIVSAVTSIPATVLDQVGAGKVDAVPKATSQQPALTADGKPLVVYLGAEYCPYCAAQRWGMVVALSRFGTFQNLTTTHSSSSDVFPNTPTLSFHGSTYTSTYLSFQGVEMQSNQRNGNTYAALDTPTAEQEQLLRTYDAPPYVAGESAGSIPFIDFGNQFISSGASVSPQLFAGKSGTDIATALTNPADTLTQAIGGSANAFTAAICTLTHNQPAAVCTSSAVTAYAGKL